MSETPVGAPPKPTLESRLQMRGIRKGFFGVQVLKGVDLTCAPGEVRAIVGENGAGKSTLMKILAGVHRADEGAILIDGREEHFRDPRAAQSAGVAIIFQEFRLLSERSVAENIFLGREPGSAARVDARAMHRATAQLLARLRVDRSMSPHTRVRDLSVAQQQMVEIAKALSLDARVLVMDEPTAALSPGEVESLFTIVRELCAAGLAIVYISHRLEEVFRLATRITVLKDGATVADVAPADVTTGELVELMVGRTLDRYYPPRRTRPPPLRQTRLRVRGGGNARLSGIDLELVAGEIVGVAGLEGAGRTELARALFGAEPFTSGGIELDGRPIPLTSPREAIDAGIAFLTEDRKAEGLLARESVLDNAKLAVRALRRKSGQKKDAVRGTAATAALLAGLDVRAMSLQVPVQFLSGGNQQKVVLAKWLATRPNVLLFDEPTRGIDIGAKAAVHEKMRALAEEGAAILMISSELSEVIGMSDRILVMRQGRIAGELEPGASEKEILGVASGEGGRREIVPVPEHEKEHEHEKGWGIWWVLAGLFVLAWLGVGNAFVGVDNLRNLLVRSVALGIVAVGQSLVLLAGSIDLSVAYLISVVAVLTSYEMQGQTSMIAPVVLLALGIGAGVGAVNGLLVTRVKVNAFMATLATGLLMRGALENSFTSVTGSVPQSFQQLGYSGIGPIPYAVLLFGAMAAGAWYLVRKTRFGYHLMAVGGDEETARVSGVRSARVVVLAHVACSLCAVVSALFLVSRVGSAAPWIGPNGRYELDSVGAVVLGGTAIMGGRGGILGTVGGVLVLAVVDNALNQLGVNTFVQDIARGVILIGAVAAYGMARGEGLLGRAFLQRLRRRVPA
ncbi:ATP-binding cassette domain-containing protein [Pendulispora rubella]|uniref:ATP-binding cassette domain-containing protein n=1 Tax=Pendulispora rubella TaxID=2741070 RepID=A0ABZ2LL96_9BACT